MKEYKLNIDRKMPSDANIEKHKDFANLLAKLPQTASPSKVAKPSFLRRYGIYFATATVALIGVGLWLSQPTKNPPENKIVADSVTQTPINAPKEEEKSLEIATKNAPALPENKTTTSPKVVVEKKKEPEKRVETATEKAATFEDAGIASKNQVETATEKAATPAIEPKVEKPVEVATPAFVTPQKPKGRTLAFKTDVSRFPELSIYQGIQWEYVGTSAEDNPYTNGVLNVKNTWKSVEIQKKDATTYFLILKDKEGKTFSFPARPVFKDKDYDEAMKIYQEKMGARE